MIKRQFEVSIHLFVRCEDEKVLLNDKDYLKEQLEKLIDESHDGRLVVLGIDVMSLNS